MEWAKIKTGPRYRQTHPWQPHNFTDLPTPKPPSSQASQHTPTRNLPTATPTNPWIPAHRTPAFPLHNGHADTCTTEKRPLAGIYPSPYTRSLFSRICILCSPSISQWKPKVDAESEQRDGAALKESAGIVSELATGTLNRKDTNESCACC